MTTTCDSDTDIDAGELVKTDNEERFVDLVLGISGEKIVKGMLFAHLESEYFWLHKEYRLAIYFDEAFAFLSYCQEWLGSSVFYIESTLQWATAVAAHYQLGARVSCYALLTSLLLAEALHALGSRHACALFS